MEEQLTPLLINIIEEDQNTQVNMKILEKYYQLFDSKKYLGSSFKEIYKDMKDAYSINLQSFRYGNNNRDEQITYHNLILAVINEFDTKKKRKLIPLIIYLDNNRILYNYLYKINYFNNFVFDIKEFFIGTIRDSGIKVNNIEELSPYDQEKEWFEKYNKGIESLNFKQIYSFVEGIERGMGDQSDIYLDFLTFIAYKYFFEDLVKIANNKKDMFEIIYLINLLDIEETLILALKSNNYLLKFESLRKAVYFQSNNYYCLNLLKPERKLISDIIIEFSKEKNIWKHFLDFYLEYPLRSGQLFHPLSNVIIQVDNKSVDMLLENIKMDRHLSDDSKEALNSCFLSIEDKDIQEDILEKLFNKWENFIENYNEYFGEIILTDIIDIVNVYVRDLIDKDLLIHKLEKTLYELDEIDTKWFENRLEKENYFYKQMSKLLIYSSAIEKYQLFNIKKKIQKICESSLILQKEYNKTTILLFNEYFLVNKVESKK